MANLKSHLLREPETGCSILLFIFYLTSLAEIYLLNYYPSPPFQWKVSEPLLYSCVYPQQLEWLRGSGLEFTWNLMNWTDSFSPTNLMVFIAS